MDEQMGTLSSKEIPNSLFKKTLKLVTQPVLNVAIRNDGYYK